MSDERTQAALIEITNSYINELPVLEREVVKHYFGVAGGEQERSLEEVAKTLSISPKKAEETLTSALRNLRKPKFSLRALQETADEIRDNNLSFAEAKAVVGERLPEILPTVEKHIDSVKNLIALLALIVAFVAWRFPQQPEGGTPAAPVFINQTINLSEHPSGEDKSPEQVKSPKANQKKTQRRKGKRKN